MTENECFFLEKLIEWWEKTNKQRRYPWRETRDLYKVIIAELLLQRTRRDKVQEVFTKFINRFPTPEVLACARLEDIETIIHELGLKKRALYLIRLAKKMKDHYDELERKGNFEMLPGVGKYIASAARIILKLNTTLYPDASIARVFSRLFDKKLNERRPADTPWVIEILNKCSPTDVDLKKKYFLALIDLAWEVCKPKKPKCDECPLKRYCRYFLRRNTT